MNNTLLRSSIESADPTNFVSCLLILLCGSGDSYSETSRRKIERRQDMQSNQKEPRAFAWLELVSTFMNLSELERTYLAKAQAQPMTALLDGTAVLVVGSSADGSDGCGGKAKEERGRVDSVGRLITAGELGHAATLEVVALYIVRSFLGFDAYMYMKIW